MARRRSTTEEKPPVAGAVAEEKVERAPEDELPTFVDSAAKVESAGQDVVYEFEPDTPTTGPKEPSEDKKPEGDGTPAKVTDADKAKNLQYALREERDKRREERHKHRSVLAELEETRTRLRLVDEQRQREQSNEAKAARAAKLDEAVDIKEALPHITEAVRADLDPFIASARRAGIKASERVSRLIHTDYDEVLQKSGVQAAITIDPATGKAPDPVMWNMLIIRSDDPAEDAYSLALDLLEKQGIARPDPAPPQATETVVLEEKAGDRTDGRREVLDTLSQNADRPRGIGSLPAAEGKVVRRLTSEAISQMSDAEYARLPAHIREAYLAGGQL